jgi:hypothetical protein
MTPAERDRAVAYLTETKCAVIDSTRGLSDAQWRHKPSAEEWSIAECVEHLGIVEERVLRGLAKMASAPAAPGHELALAAGKEDLMITEATARSQKIKAPPQVMPHGDCGDDPSRLIARFIEVRERVIVYAQSTSDPLRTRLLPHPMFGPIDGFQWLIFVAGHSERHRLQMEDVKTSAGFPGA